MPVIGETTSSSTTSAPTANAAGRRAISALQRPQPRGSASSATAEGTFTRLPQKPSSAGSSVSELIIVSATAAADAIAGPLRNDTPSSNIPNNAITTVVPAKS